MLLYDFRVTCSLSTKSTNYRRGIFAKLMRNSNCEEEIEELNKLCGFENLQEELCAFIYRVSSKEIYFFTAVDRLQQITPDELEKFLLETFEEDYGVQKFKVTELKEITVEQLGKFIERSDFLNFYRLSQELKLNYRDNSTFKLSESIVKDDSTSFDEVCLRAQKLMADDTFIDELRRIYSEENSREKFFGHPVHYKILAGNHGAAMDMIDLLVQALFVNNRVVSRRINRISNVTDCCFDEIDLDNICRRADGGVVVIETRGIGEDIDNYATSYEEVIKYISTTVLKYQRNTLFIFVEQIDKPGFSKNFIAGLQDDLPMIEIQEGAGNRQQALEYLMSLRKNSDLPFYSDEDLEDALGDKLTFRASDIHQIFEKLYNEGLKNKIYRAYKSAEYVRIEEDDSDKKDARKKLDEMIGLTEQKEILKEILTSFKVQKMRREVGLKTKRASLHMVFTGNPGSAKTTVARLFAEILSKEGLLETGHFIECGRADLVGKYVGWTAKIVREKFRRANGGILFIDEAYSLVDDRAGLYGDEAISTIVQEMENHRKDVIVIFAGYTDKMKDFLERNEGLRSRIAFHVDFPDYKTNDLLEILKLMARREGYEISSAALKSCKKIFDKACGHKNFGNGRFVRNLLEQAIIKQSKRLLSDKDTEIVSKQELAQLNEDDFQVNASKLYLKDTSKIGFSFS